MLGYDMLCMTGPVIGSLYIICCEKGKEREKQVEVQMPLET